jgi:PilZ domain
MELALRHGEGQNGGGTVSEGRTGKRFPLELPIRIHKENAAGEASGVTGNLSAAGVYIRADAALDVGSPVEFEITLPPEVTGGKENVVIQCRGRVVRTDEPARAGDSAEARGVACVIDSYEFVRNS